MTDKTNEMIERVAKAIWKAREETFPPRVRRNEPDDLDKTSGAWASVLAMAVGAIEAMRDPTIDMVGDAVHAWNTHDDCEEDVDGIWRAMIDTALA